MSPFNKVGAADNTERPASADLMSTVSSRLAQAIEQQEAANPSRTSHEFRQALTKTLADLALQEVIRLEQLSGIALLRRLSNLQALERNEVSQEQARLLGAFEEFAIDQADCELDAAARSANELPGNQDGEHHD